MKYKVRTRIVLPDGTTYLPSNKLVEDDKFELFRVTRDLLEQNAIEPAKEKDVDAPLSL